jgi:adenosylcobyric acid synthase
VVILPGSKSTIADLAFFRAQGWDIDLAAHLRRGGRVLGLCGGYQMLGRSISDPDGVEGPAGSVAGLGLLDVHTVLTGRKITRPVVATHIASGEPVSGYEIHLGRTTGPDCARPLLTLEGHPEGATSADGRVTGTYLHGLFTGDSFRKHWLADFGQASALAYGASVEATLDALAEHLEGCVDVERVVGLAG